MKEPVFTSGLSKCLSMAGMMLHVLCNDLLGLPLAFDSSDKTLGNTAGHTPSPEISHRLQVAGASATYSGNTLLTKPFARRSPAFPGAFAVARDMGLQAIFASRGLPAVAWAPAGSAPSEPFSIINGPASPPRTLLLLPMTEGPVETWLRGKPTSLSQRTEKDDL